MVLFRPLQKGDLIDIVAPGWVCKPGTIEPAIKHFESWGLKVRFPQDLLEPWTFYSNTDEKRAQFLSHALKAKDSKAVWCLRGGSGSQRILPAVFKSKAPAAVKMLIGFSDMTAVHAGLGKIWKWPSIHGAMFERLGALDLPADVVEQTRALVFGELSELTYPELEPMNAAARKSKKIQGTMIGGNLVTFQSLLGTKFFPKTAGSILFFEDIGERGYRIDRIWTQFEQAGVFKNVRAIVLGQFTGGEEAQTNISRVPEALENIARSVKCPVYSKLEVGHGLLQRPVICGAAGIIEKNRLRIPLKWSKK